MKKVVLLGLLFLALTSIAYATCNIDIIDEFITPFQVGVPGSFTFTPCCGTPPYTFTLYAGTMPLYAAIARENFPLRMMGISVNVMSLAGVAIAFGELIDASIVVAEQTHKKLERWEALEAK